MKLLYNMRVKCDAKKRRAPYPNRYVNKGEGTGVYRLCIPSATIHSHNLQSGMRHGRRTTTGMYPRPIAPGNASSIHRNRTALPEMLNDTNLSVDGTCPKALLLRL